MTQTPINIDLNKKYIQLHPKHSIEKGNNAAVKTSVTSFTFLLVQDKRGKVISAKRRYINLNSIPIEYAVLNLPDAGTKSI